MRRVKLALAAAIALAAVAILPGTAQADRFSWAGPYADYPTCRQALFEFEDAGYGVAACRLNGTNGAPASPAGWYFPYAMFTP